MQTNVRSVSCVGKSRIAILKAISKALWNRRKLRELHPLQAMERWLLLPTLQTHQVLFGPNQNAVRMQTVQLPDLRDGRHDYAQVETAFDDVVLGDLFGSPR